MKNKIIIKITNTEFHMGNPHVILYEYKFILL